ncbi:MAG: hypothetical protein ACRD4X_03955 [Candidatus Acidiferrales bacterium]
MKYHDILDTVRRPSVAKPLQGVLAGALTGILALAALVSVRAGFDFVKEFQFESAAKREAQLAAATGRTESDIRGSLCQKAQTLGLPVDPDSIEVHVTPAPADDQDTGNLFTMLGVQRRIVRTGHVKIAVSYDLPYRYPGGTAMIHFHFAVSDQDI